MKTTYALLASSLLFATATTANAALVFLDNFESPDVTAAQSTGNTNGTIPTGWVGSTDGFGSGRRGVIDESAGAFTDPVGQQAFAFRYTNSGLTSAFGEIGVLTAGDTITVSFDVVADSGALPYNAALVTFNGAGIRTSTTTSLVNNTSSVLKSVSGNATANGAYTTISFNYVVGDPVVDNNGAGAGVSTAWSAALLGQDIAIRFKGATSSANIDNVSVNIISVPEPGSLALLGLGGLLLVARRRRSA